MRLEARVRGAPHVGEENALGREHGASGQELVQLGHGEEEHVLAASQRSSCWRWIGHGSSISLAEIDAALQPKERDSVGLVVGLRPYVLSLFTRLKRAKRT